MKHKERVLAEWNDGTNTIHSVPYPDPTTLEKEGGYNNYVFKWLAEKTGRDIETLKFVTYERIA